MRADIEAELSLLRLAVGPGAAAEAAEPDEGWVGEERPWRADVERRLSETRRACAAAVSEVAASDERLGRRVEDAQRATSAAQAGVEELRARLGEPALAGEGPQGGPAEPAEAVLQGRLEELAELSAQHAAASLDFRARIARLGSEVGGAGSEAAEALAETCRLRAELRGAAEAGEERRSGLEREVRSQHAALGARLNLLERTAADASGVAGTDAVDRLGDRAGQVEWRVSELHVDVAALRDAGGSTGDASEALALRVRALERSAEEAEGRLLRASEELRELRAACAEPGGLARAEALPAPQALLAPSAQELRELGDDVAELRLSQRDLRARVAEAERGLVERVGRELGERVEAVWGAATVLRISYGRSSVFGKRGSCRFCVAGFRCLHLRKAFIIFRKEPVRFDSFRFRIFRKLIGSVRPVRFGFLFLPDFWRRCGGS